MVSVEPGLRAVPIELDLDLHLGTGRRFAAHRADRSTPRTAEPSVGAPRRKPSSPDRFSGVLSETGIVGDGLISRWTPERSSYRRPPPFDASERAARPPRSGNSRRGAESTSNLGPRLPSACSGSSSSAHRSRRTRIRRPEHPSDRQRGLSAGCRQRSCAGLPREQGWNPLTGICRYRDLFVNFGFHNTYIPIAAMDCLSTRPGLSARPRARRERHAERTPRHATQRAVWEALRKAATTSLTSRTIATPQGCSPDVSMSPWRLPAANRRAQQRGQRPENLRFGLSRAGVGAGVIGGRYWI